MLSILVTILPIFAIIILGKILKNTLIPSQDFWRNSEKITYYGPVE